MGKNERDAKAAKRRPDHAIRSKPVRGQSSDATTQGPILSMVLFRIVNRGVCIGREWGCKKKRGLTLVAYPMQYQSSGVKTFVVTQRGVVFETTRAGTTTVAHR